MTKFYWILSVAGLLATGPCWAGQTLPIQASILVISSGKEVARIRLPMGMKGTYDINGNTTENDQRNGVLRVLGNAQVRFTPADAGIAPMDFIGDELILTQQPLDPQKLRAIVDLEAMGESDQRYRGAPQAMDAASWLLQERIDLANMTRLEEIIGQYGWPGARLVGIKASDNAFLVLQHGDLKSQQRHLPAFRAAVVTNDAPASQLALLEDRVRVDQGQAQIYGSQVKDGKPAPIEDEANVDRRRAAIGLMPLAAYLKLLGVIYAPAPPAR